MLRRSIEALAWAGVGRIVIVTSPARVAEIAAAAWLPVQVVAVVAGGARRQDSVAAGVAALAEATAGPRRRGTAKRNMRLPPRRRRLAGDPVILVHDAARPLASPALIRAVASGDRQPRSGHPGVAGD